MAKKFFIFAILIIIIGGIAAGISVTLEKKINRVYPAQSNFQEKVRLENSERENLLKEIYLPDLTKIKKDLLSEQIKFIELDLKKMKAKLYRDRETIKELPLLVKGEPMSWSSTPVGLYRVSSKYRVAFSNSSQVYMPYAIKFYGKYFLHGEPYYPGGRLLRSRYSGGCIRLTNNNAKTLYNFAKIGMPILIIDNEFINDNYKYSLKTSLFPEISAKGYLVADLNNGFVFAEKNSSQKFPIASLTKLMTSLVTVENVNLRKTILASSEMIEPFKSYAWFRPALVLGKRYRVVELLYPTLVQSSNDSVKALTYFLGEEQTIKKMNEKAKTIGMFNSRFIESTGLDKKNVSTAQDLFYLGKYILNSHYPLLRITKNEKVPSYGLVKFENLRNKNIFFNDSDFIGGKTGFLDKYTGLFIFRLKIDRDTERDIAIILLDSDHLKQDSLKIINWLKKNYSYSSWIKVTSNAPWSKRDASGLVVFKDKIWLFGGLEGKKELCSGSFCKYWKMPQKSDVWVSQNGKDWKLVTNKAPWGKRRSMGVVVFQDKIWVIGGHQQGGTKNDVWYSLDGENWIEATSSAAWTPREGHTIVIFKDKMWLMGGVNFEQRVVKNDIWYSEDGINWIEATSSVSWSPRYDHTTQVFGGKMWLMGGVTFNEEAKNDIWVSENGKDWQIVTNNAVWPQRHGHTSVIFRDKIWIISGWDTLRDEGLKDVWYSKDGYLWEEIPNPPWIGREDHVAIVFKDKIWIMGGMDSNWNWKNDIWYGVFRGDS